MFNWVKARSMERNLRYSWILYSTPWMPDSRCWIWDSWPRELGFRIPIASGFRNPWAVFQIPKLEFQILQAKFFRKQKVLDSGFPYMGRQSFILGYFIYQWISRANSCWPTTTRQKNWSGCYKYPADCLHTYNGAEYFYSKNKRVALVSGPWTP